MVWDILGDIIIEFFMWLVIPPDVRGTKRLLIIAKRLLAVVAIIAVIVLIIVLIVWVTNHLGNLPVSAPTPVSNTPGLA